MPSGLTYTGLQSNRLVLLSRLGRRSTCHVLCFETYSSLTRLFIYPRRVDTQKCYLEFMLFLFMSCNAVINPITIIITVPCFTKWILSFGIVSYLGKEVFRPVSFTVDIFR